MIAPVLIISTNSDTIHPQTALQGLLSVNVQEEKEKRGVEVEAEQGEPSLWERDTV